jgi:tRNA (guanine-N7-)-methyltransferase
LLKLGGEIHFKTDNEPLFEYSVEQLSENGFKLSSVTRNLHEAGAFGAMTDYEAKFHAQGIPICRLEAKLS